MDLRQLEYLVGVADHGGFGAAARALHVSQPSLSHGIRSLEATLGVELFARLGRRVEPTAAGRAVIDGARRVLREAAELSVTAATVTSLATGSLTLAALPTLAADPLAELIGRFRIAYRGVTVHVLEPEDTVEIELAVRDGRAELGLTDLTTGGYGLERVELFRQGLVVACPPGTELDEGPITARQLAALPLIVTPPGTSTRRLLERTLANNALTMNVAVELSHREAIVPLVLAGAVAALLPEHTAARAAEQGAVVRPLRPAVIRRVGLLHRRSRRSPAALAMIALARGDQGSRKTSAR